MTHKISPKEIYKILKNDDNILKIYSDIEKFEIDTGGWAFHNIDHVKNVSKIADKILLDFDFDEDIIYKCKIACLLHDVGALQGKDGHAERSFEYAVTLFKEKNWDIEYYNDVFTAIKNHSDGFETDNIIALAIILADKLDIKKSRISEEGMKIIGNRQYAHIEDIIVNINNDILTVDFITDGNIDIEEVSNYYFTSKVFKAIEAFSNKLNLKYNILMDNNIWNL